MSYKNEISIEGSRFELVNQQVESYCSTGPYNRVEGKTDRFYLYERKDSSKQSIVLFNEKTIKDFFGGTHGKIIALKQKPWEFEDIVPSDKLQNISKESIANHHLNEVRKILNYDSMTEGDSLRFFNYVASSNVSAPDEIWPILLLWLRDEQNHHRGFEAIYKQLFGRTENERKVIDDEPSNFLPFEKILSDPFKMLVALSYDEAATISGYLNDMPVYEDISPEVAAFVQRAISDEGWHLSKFAAMAAKYWPERLDELDEVLDEACSSDGQDYQRTFFLDHDPSVESQFDHELMERAKAVSKKIILAKGKIKGFQDTSTHLAYFEDN